MVLLFFFLCALGGGLMIFLSRSHNCSWIWGISVLSIQTWVSLYAFLHRGLRDSLYFRFDSLGILFSLVLTVLLWTTLYHTRFYFRRRQENPREQSIYMMALIFLGTAMTGANFADHLGMLWVCIEATTLSVTALIYHERTPLSLEATWKYLFVSSIGITIAFSGILVLSMAAHAQGVAELQVEHLAAAASRMNPLWLNIAFLLVLTGYSAKIGLFPLHAAAIDAKTVTPYQINGLISTALVNVGFLGVLRMMAILKGTDSALFARQVLLIAGLVSLAIAAFHLLRVKQLKRMFAFSTLEHMGITALALGTGGAGIYAGLLHLLLHSFAKASLFYQAGQVHAVYQSYSVEDTGNYLNLHPSGAAALILSLLTITAIPPSGLFVTEFLIFRSLFQARLFLAALPALFLITVILYVLSSRIFRLLYAASPLASPLSRVRRAETFSQFLLLGALFYFAYSPPALFSELLRGAAAVMGGSSW